MLFIYRDEASIPDNNKFYSPLPPTVINKKKEREKGRGEIAVANVSLFAPANFLQTFSGEVQGKGRKCHST